MRFRNPGHDDDEDEEKYFNESDDNDDDDDFDEIYFQENKEIKMAELSLVEFNLNRRILVGVVKSLETSFWWKFLRHKTRLKMIVETYQTFNKLIEDQEQEQEEE